MVRQSGVQPHPATVAAAVQSHDPIVMMVRLLALDPQIALAAEFDGRVAHFHANALAAAVAQPP
jgi:hypothetical protein